jgi:GT2 family glycosyltransferase
MWFDLCRSNTNLGIVKGRNRAVETFLRFDRFIILDDDQMVGPGWLEPLQSKMEEGYDLVGHEAWRMIQPPNPRAYWPFRKCHSRDEPYSYLGCGGQLVSRKLYDKIGLYDEQFNPAYFEDPDLSFRAVRSGFKITWTPSNIEHVGHQTVNRQTLFNKTEQFSKSWHLFKQKWMPYYQEITKDGVRIYKPDVVPSAATG